MVVQTLASATQRVDRCDVPALRDNDEVLHVRNLMCVSNHI